MDAADQEATSGATAGFQVEIVQGTIENQQVDALVSPMIGHDPVSTRIGKTLSSIAGAELKAKFDKKAGEATLPSETVVVEGLPGLQCKAAIFLNLLCWDNNQHGTAVQALRQGIKKVLAVCNIRAYTSVALPVLGTGVLIRFPHDVASTILLEEVGVTGQNRASRSPFLVRIIVHPKDKESHQAFQSAQGLLHQRGFIKSVNPSEGSFYQSVSVNDNEITAMMGGVKLQILCGDIINAGTDVIVNTTNFTNLGFGVCKAILTAAGPAVLAELKKVGIPADLICTTGGGHLECKQIIHARFKGNTQRIRNTCKTILQLCDSNGFNSVAFPAINTGQAGMDSADACEAMLDGMSSAIKDRNMSSLSLIRIVILPQPVFQAFRSKLQSRCHQVFQSCFSLKGIAKESIRKLQEMYSRSSSSLSPQCQTFVLPIQESHYGPSTSQTMKDLDGIWEQELSEGTDKEGEMLLYTTAWAIKDENGEFQELCLLDKDAQVTKGVSIDMMTKDGRRFKVNLIAGEATECLTGKIYKLKNMAPETAGVGSALALELPPHWEPMSGEDFKKVELQPDSPEYQEVAKGFLVATSYNIHKIERVQNVYLWHAFSVCRRRILSKNGEAELGEKVLYHGTSAAACDSIERDRFDRSYAGQHAALYGKGVYFAVNPSYSADWYSQPDQSGLKRLYVARVLTGRHTVGDRCMKAPPRRGEEAMDCFDSLVNNLQQPTIFVIFHDDQAYPEYLITFS